MFTQVRNEIKKSTKLYLTAYMLKLTIFKTFAFVDRTAKWLTTEFMYNLSLLLNESCVIVNNQVYHRWQPKYRVQLCRQLLDLFCVERRLQRFSFFHQRSRLLSSPRLSVPLEHSRLWSPDSPFRCNNLLRLGLKRTSVVRTMQLA